MEPIVIPTAYLPAIAYFLMIIQSNAAIIDIHEHYIKQTCRNRCSIYTANGAIPLIIPVVKVFGNHTPVKDIEIAHSQRWQSNHWQAIESAYQSSPYFLYYKDDLQAFYQKKYTHLIEFNMELLLFIHELTGLKTHFVLSESYLSPGSSGKDLRNELSLNLANAFPTEFYPQVFQHKFGFISNLSIIDLLFNLGPETRAYLERQSLLGPAE